MTVLGCKWHPSQDNVGVCAHCLRESLSRLATYRDEEDDPIDLEIFPPSKPSRVPVTNRRAQFLVVQYDEDGNRVGMGGENSELFFPTTGRRAIGVMVGNDNTYAPYEHEPTHFNLDGADHADRQGEASTSEDSGSGGQNEAIPQIVAPVAEPGEISRYRRKNYSSNGRRKPKSWGAAMLKMVGFRTLSVLWKSERKAEHASSSKLKVNEQGYDGSVDLGTSAHDQQFTPARFSVSSGLEQSTPARYSVSSQWEQTTPARYSVASINDQITPARYSGASLFDIESMDSRRVSTSSRGGSPFTTHKPIINGENFNAAWRASKSMANARRMGAFEGFGSSLNEHYLGKSSHSTFNPSFRNNADEGHGREPREASQVKKTSWKWFPSFKGVPSREERKEGTSTSQKVAVEAPSDIGYQERRKSTSSVFSSKPKDRIQHPLTPNLCSKKSPWWRASPQLRAQRSPITIPAKPENRDQEVAVSTDSDLMDDTPHRLSSASPLVGYSRSSSNGSSCFTTPRWNARQRMHNGNRGLGIHDRDNELPHLAI